MSFGELSMDISEKKYYQNTSVMIPEELSNKVFFSFLATTSRSRVRRGGGSQQAAIRRKIQSPIRGRVKKKDPWHSGVEQVHDIRNY